MVEVQNYLRAKAKVCQPEQAAQFLGGRVGGRGVGGWHVQMVNRDAVVQFTARSLNWIENSMIRQAG